MKRQKKNPLLALIDSYKKKLAKLSVEEIAELVDNIAHVGDGQSRAMQEHGLTLDEIRELMLDNGYEKCRGCGWFVESSELLGENMEQTLCENCDSKKFKD